MTPEEIAVQLLAKFLEVVITKAPELIPKLLPEAETFWGDNNLGPLPPSLQSWMDIDATIDSERNTQTP